LDGTDNFDTRFKVNKACVEEKKPLVSAAVIRFEGQLSVFKGYENTSHVINVYIQLRVIVTRTV
jgi:Dinucleotide-utilizing enzymes involved in molybdopterin and thiamine biosynthesis family 2